MDEELPELADLLPMDMRKTAMEHKADELITSLYAGGHLAPAHQLTAQLILELSRVIGLASLKGQAAGMALASKQLLDALATLPPPPVVDDFAVFLDTLNAVNDE